MSAYRGWMTASSTSTTMELETEPVGRAKPRDSPLPGDAAAQVWEMIERLQEVRKGTWVEQIEKARDLFTCATDKIGVLYYTYQLILSPHLPEPCPSEHCVITTMPTELLGEYQGFEYHATDNPAAAKAMRSVRPFLWTHPDRKPTGSSTGHETAGIARDTLNRADPVLIIPIHAGSEFAMLNVVAQRQKHDELQRHTHVLYLLAHFLHHEMRRALLEVALSVSPRRRSLLSPRETEVLSLAARGKSTAEIASILRLSTKGVEFHIEGAKRKLHVSNRTHAVAKAITLGLLALEA